MKQKIFLPILFLLIWSCNDFLEESSQDEVRPATVDDLEQLLNGSAYITDHRIYIVTDIFTDNIVCNGVTFAMMYQSAFDNQKWLFTWDEEMYTEGKNGNEKSVWQTPYEAILGCNLILDNLDEVSGSNKLRESLRGEALALRSFFYLQLVNFFGIAYTQGNPRADLAVPLKLTSSVTGEFFRRNTVEEVYTQIEKDLLRAIDLLNENDFDRNYFRIGHLAAKAILSRVYLYMGEWDKAIKYADMVLNVKPNLLDLNTVGWQTFTSHVASVYSTHTPDEIIWGRKYSSSGYSNPSGGYKPPYTISDNLSNLYEMATAINQADGTIRDLRGYLYFGWANIGTYRLGIAKGDNDMGSFNGIRTAELYLNRAEAYAQKYLLEGNTSHSSLALESLNTLRRSRYNNNFEYQNLNATNGDELLKICLEERQRELSGETNHRWCDLRRYGKIVEHILVLDTDVEYVKDFSKYVLPIPEEILRVNPNLIQN